MSRLRPRKALGQHWLVDRRALAKIVAAAELTGEDTVIEVGAGSGLLTEAIAARAGHVIAVEVDGRLAHYLEERFAQRANVTIVCADVLSLSPEELLAQGGATPPYLVMGNLPFFIASAVIRRFLAARSPPQRLIVTVQAEVAQNIAARPGQMTFLSVLMQYYAQPRILFYIPPRSFRPPPKVRSAVVRLEVRPRPAVAVDDREAFFRLVQAGFAAPRKHLRNSLALGLGLPSAAAEHLLAAASIEPTRRPQTLSLEEWANLYLAYRQGVMASPQ